MSDQRIDPTVMNRLIYKILILGLDETLQVGYLNETARTALTYQLYSTLGIGLGVSRYEHLSGHRIVLQMWSIPSAERFHGITHNLTRGHHGSIFVIASDQIENLDEILPMVNEKGRKSTIVVIVGNETISSNHLEILEDSFGKTVSLELSEELDSIMEVYVDSLLRGHNNDFLKVYVVSESTCPRIEPVPGQSRSALCSDEEISILADFAEELGLVVEDDICEIPIEEGIINIQLVTGEVTLSPETCKFCVRSCKRDVHVCIVRLDAGWTNCEIGDRALLAMAKIFALQSRQLPKHVEDQLHNAVRCKKFELDPYYSSMPETLLKLQKLGYISKHDEESLLELAVRRFREGRISERVLETLKRILNV